MREGKLKKVLISLCGLAVFVTSVGVVNAFEPLQRWFFWSAEKVKAAFAGVYQADLGNLISISDLPIGWATLMGIVIGVSLIAWQMRSGFRLLAASHAQQAALQRDTLLETAKLEREAREHLARMESDVRDDLERKDAVVLAAALRGDLMAAAYQLNNRLIWLEGVQDVLDDIIRNGLTRIPYTFEIQRVATPSYDANSPRLATLGPSLAADVAQIYAFLLTEHKWTEAGGCEPRAFKVLISTIQDATAIKLTDTVQVCKRLLAFEVNDPAVDPGPIAGDGRDVLQPAHRPTTHAQQPTTH